jgi:hypothetical protein
MDLAIVDLARRMRDAFYAPHREQAWDIAPESVRRAFVRAAIVARPDLVEGIAVAPDSWLAGVLPVVCHCGHSVTDHDGEGDIGASRGCLQTCICTMSARQVARGEPYQFDLSRVPEEQVVG